MPPIRDAWPTFMHEKPKLNRYEPPKPVTKSYRVDWYCFAADEWIQGDAIHADRAGAERELSQMLKQGFHENLTRIVEVQS